MYKNKSWMKISPYVQFNPITERIWPSHKNFTLLTMFIIIAPSLCCILGLVVFNPYVPLVVKVWFAGLNCCSLGLSMKYLLQCAATDPGYIPSKKLLRLQGIEEDVEAGEKVDPEKSYYV